MIPVATGTTSGVRRFLATVKRWARRLLVLGLATAAALGAGLVWFAETIPRGEAPDPATVQEQTEAIVVLTGGSERLVTGLGLLAAGTGRQLFISGVYRALDLRGLLDHHAGPAARNLAKNLDCCVTLGHAAQSTAGNAAETAAWMRSRGFTSLRLVTANYHMRRSLMEFRMALPEARIIPHPVAPNQVRLAEWWWRPGTARLIITEYVKLLIVLARFALVQIAGLWPDP